jgi:hypothetical protein
VSRDLPPGIWLNRPVPRPVNAVAWRWLIRRLLLQPPPPKPDRRAEPK